MEKYFGVGFCFCIIVNIWLWIDRWRGEKMWSRGWRWSMSTCKKPTAALRKRWELFDFILFVSKYSRLRLFCCFFTVFFDKLNVMRALSLDKSNGEGTRSDEDALENQSIRGMVYIITLSLSLFISLFICNIFLCFTAGHQAWNYHQSRT